MARKRVSARRASSATPPPTSTSVTSSGGTVSARRVSARPSARPSPQPAYVEPTAPAAQRAGVMDPAEVKKTTSAPRRARGARPGSAGTLKIADRYGNEVPAQWYVRNKGKGSFSPFPREREDRENEAERYPGWGNLPRDYDTGFPVPESACGYDKALWPAHRWGRDEDAPERGALGATRASVLKKIDGKLRPVRLTPFACVSVHAKARRNKASNAYYKHLDTALAESVKKGEAQFRAQPRRGKKGWAYYHLVEQAKDPMLAQYMTKQARDASEAAWAYKDALDAETGGA